MELNQKFMFHQKEFEIVNINELKKTVHVIPVEKTIILPEIKSTIQIDDLYLKVFYINEGKNRITLTY